MKWGRSGWSCLWQFTSSALGWHDGRCATEMVSRQERMAVLSSREHRHLHSSRPKRRVMVAGYPTPNSGWWNNNDTGGPWEQQHPGRRSLDQPLDHCLVTDGEEGLSFMVSFRESSLNMPKKLQNFSRTFGRGLESS